MIQAWNNSLNIGGSECAAQGQVHALTRAANHFEVQVSLASSQPPAQSLFCLIRKWDYSRRAEDSDAGQPEKDEHTQWAEADKLKMITLYER